MTYVMYNFDLGYVQGMSDLLSPILCLMESEVDAFWCFVGFMDKVVGSLLDIRRCPIELHETLLNKFLMHGTEYQFRNRSGWNESSIVPIIHSLEHYGPTISSLLKSPGFGEHVLLLPLAFGII